MPPQFQSKSMYHAYELPNSRIIKWSDVPKSEFLTNYIHAQKLTYSGFSFFDLNGKHRVVFSLDRIQDKAFSDRDQPSAACASHTEQYVP